MRAAAHVSLLALATGLAGCGGADAAQSSAPTISVETPAHPGEQTSSASPTAPTGLPEPTGTPEATGTPEPTLASPSPTPRCDLTAGTIPEGRWQGPITMEVHARGDESGYEDSTGTGRLRLSVRAGKVTGGSLRIVWTSHGEAETDEASATVDLTGKIDGTAHGTAGRPRLTAPWSIAGTATVTRPVESSAPFHEIGRASAPAKVGSVNCARVLATFVLTLDSKEAATTFTGTAKWVGSRS